MNKYQSYKPSDIIWIDSIPSHWVSSKLKFVLNRIVTGGTPDTSNDSFWSDEGGFNWISISDMTSNPNGIEFTRKKISDIGLENKRLEVLPINSIIYSICGSIGKVNKLKIESTIHQGILGLIPNTLIENDFLNYYLKYIQDFVSILSSSNTQENLNLDKVRNIGIVIPPIQEQIQIIKFLDKKTDLLDNLISKKEKIISILNEQRTLIINQVVTKGLNSNVKMKNSEVEWIGEIPESWVVKKFTYITNTINCGYTSTPDYVDDGVMFLSSQNVKKGKLDLWKYNFIPRDLHNELTKNRKVKKGDLLVVRVGVGIGNSCVVDIDEEFSIYVSLTHVSLKEGYLNYYFNYMFNSSNFIDECLLLSKQGGGVGNFNVKDFERFKFPVPSYKEQIQIVKHLDTITNEIDNLVELEQKKIDLLKEYRQSLISDVVTGKIKVTN